MSLDERFFPFAESDLEGSGDTTPAPIGADAREQFVLWHMRDMSSGRHRAAQLWDEDHLVARAWRAALASAAHPASNAVAYGLEAWVDGGWHLQWPLRPTEAEAEQDRAMYAADAELRVVRLSAGAPKTAPVMGTPVTPAEAGNCCNAWFCSLPEGYQAVLREDKWMLAHAAFDAGRASRGQAPAPAAVAGPSEAPEGWRNKFAEAVYVDLEAADNQDVSLEEYPARILKVLDSIVGPRHPTVIHWRNDAIQACIAIAYKYCRDPESFQYLKQDLQALIFAAPKAVPAPTTQAAPTPAAQGDTEDAARYRWLRNQGFKFADVDLGTDSDGENFVGYRIKFHLPEPANSMYEDDEWEAADIDAAIDAARARGAKGESNAI